MTKVTQTLRKYIHIVFQLKKKSCEKLGLFPSACFITVAIAAANVH
jgi:hypothetical protein